MGLSESARSRADRPPLSDSGTTIDPATWSAGGSKPQRHEPCGWHSQSANALPAAAAPPRAASM